MQTLTFVTKTFIMYKAILFFICCVALSCCVKSKNQVSASGASSGASNCDKIVLIDGRKYESSTSDKFALLDASMNENCLSVKINYAGGCEDVTLDLIDADIVMESEPVQRKIKLLLDDQDDCEALVTKTFTFDLSSLKSNPKYTIMLRLDNWEKPILY